jgi:AraC family transcriptional regulator
MRELPARRRHAGVALRQRLRLQDAALALGEGAEDLTRLALDLGFSSHSHFAQAFRAYFGTTPSRFRACRSG